MTYFLGRDVDLYITTESATNNEGGTAQSIVVASDEAVFADTSAATAGEAIPEMAVASAPKGIINDVTGIDLSISVSDEDVGPFLGKPQIMQKVELRKETVVTITKKKYNNFWDVIFNGPANSTDFVGSSTNAKRQGARFGIEYTSSTAVKIANGNQFMHDTDDIAGSTNCCYGYRLHLQLKAYDSTTGITEEVFTIPNCVMTGHTVSLNADGVTEETLEFTSSVAPSPFTPTDVSPNAGWIDVAPVTLAEL